MPRRERGNAVSKLDILLVVIIVVCFTGAFALMFGR